MNHGFSCKISDAEPENESQVSVGIEGPGAQLLGAEDPDELQGAVGGRSEGRRNLQGEVGGRSEGRQNLQGEVGGRSEGREDSEQQVGTKKKGYFKI